MARAVGGLSWEAEGSRVKPAKVEGGKVPENLQSPAKVPLSKVGPCDELATHPSCLPCLPPICACCDPEREEAAKKKRWDTPPPPAIITQCRGFRKTGYF